MTDLVMVAVWIEHIGSILSHVPSGDILRHQSQIKPHIIA